MGKSDTPGRRTSGEWALPPPNLRSARRWAKPVVRAMAPFAAAILFLAIPLFATLAGCNIEVSATSAIGRACSAEGDCPSGNMCVPESDAAECENQCVRDQDCDDGRICERFEGKLVCQLPPPRNPVDATDDAPNDIGEGARDAGDAGDATLDADASNANLDDADATPFDADASDAPFDANASDAPFDANASDAPFDANASDAPFDANASDAPFDADAGDSSDAPTCGPQRTPSTLVLFGGVGTSDLGDTWTWDGESWSEQDSGADGGPAARHNATMSTACGYAILVGGTVFPNSLLPDAWQWNGTSWSQTTSPRAARTEAAAATRGDAMYLFGGNGSSETLSANLYEYDGTWSSAPVAGLPGLAQAPTARDAITFTNTQEGLLLVGGFDTTGTAFPETWLWTDGEWVQKDPDASMMPALGLAAAAPWNNGVLLFGGEDTDGDIKGDTWMWDGSTWTRLPTQDDGPTARSSAVMGTLNGQVILFGGLDSSNKNVLGDTWIWSGSWKPGPTYGPPSRSNSTMTAY